LLPESTDEILVRYGVVTAVDKASVPRYVEVVAGLYSPQVAQDLPRPVAVL